MAKGYDDKFAEFKKPGKAAVCQHDKVVRREDGTHHCDWCEAEFFYLDLQPGRIMMQPKQPYATLRDRFAMAALTGMQANPHFDEGLATPEQRARVAYIDADAMLEARNKS